MGEQLPQRSLVERKGPVIRVVNIVLPVAYIARVHLDDLQPRRVCIEVRGTGPSWLTCASEERAEALLDGIFDALGEGWMEV